MADSNKRDSEIKFNITLDKDNMPEKITWQAEEGGAQQPKECKSIMLSMWDAAERDTLKIDLWTKDMTMDDMDTHFFQTLISMAQSYERAVQTNLVVPEMERFCQHLAEKISKASKKDN